MIRSRYPFAGSRARWLTEVDLRRCTFLAAATLVALGAIGCTQDFSQFDPAGTTTTGTTTTTGMGGAGGDGGSTTTTTTTTTPTGTEDCLNGTDDDSDGDADCADSDCVDVGCVDPGGTWEGPGILYDGPAAMAAPCPPNFPALIFEGFGNPVQEDASCTPCTCSTPTVTCTPAALTAFGNANCTGGSDALVQPTADNTCQMITPAAGTDSYRAMAPTVNASDCDDDGGDATVPPPQAGSLGRLCAGSTLGNAGCDGPGEVCAPSAIDAPFEGKVCVWRIGEHGCPSGFPDQHTFSDTLDDDRGCTDCNCGDPMATCTVTTTVYSDNACATSLATVLNNNTCVTATVGLSITNTRTTTGACAASGGNPTGDVDLGPNRLTVCCAQ